MALKTWKNVNRLRWRQWAKGLISAWQQAERKSVAEWRQVHDGTPVHSCSYLFRKEEILKKISLSLTISLAIVHPIAGWQSRNVGDHEGLSQLFHFSSEEHLYLAGPVVKKSELLLLWRIHILFVSLQFTPISCFPVTVSLKMPALIWKDYTLVFS